MTENVLTVLHNNLHYVRLSHYFFNVFGVTFAALAQIVNFNFNELQFSGILTGVHAKLQT